MATLEALHETGTALGKVWGLAPATRRSARLGQDRRACACLGTLSLGELSPSASTIMSDKLRCLGPVPSLWPGPGAADLP